MLSNMSLTMLVRGLLAIFAAALVVMSAVNLASSWGAYSTAQRVQQINAVSDALLEATENLAVERGTTNTALRAAERADDGTLKAIETRRTNSAAALERAREGLTRISFANDRTLTADMDGAIQRLDALRAQADRALTQPQNARDAGAVNQWMPTVVGAMEAIADLSGAVGFEIKLTDPFIGEQTALKESAWTVRDFAGRQRAAMGAAIAAQRGLSVQEQTAIAAHRGRVEQAWAEIEAMSQRVGAPQEVIQAVADVKQTYFTRFGDESGRVLETLSKGQAVSMTGPEWYALSNPPLASIMSVKDASVSVTEAYARNQVNGALWSLTLNGLLMAGALALTAAVFLLTTKRLANPLAALIATVEQLTEEKFDIDVPCREQSDELGQMAKALDTLRLQAAEAQALRADAAAKQAAELERAQKIAGLTQDFDEQVTKALQIVEAAATELEASAQSLSGISDDASKSATIAASAAEQTTANVQTVAAATEEMSSSIQEITRQMNGSLTVSNEAVSEVKRTNGIVQGLASSAQKIGDVIGLINDIAEQTNLLALNATIEAARAGEHGKGFAVVASEVKTLANQTARATDEISEQISSMQSVTQTAVDAIETIGKTIMQINENIEAIAAAAEEQGVATQEISRNVQEAAQGTQQVSDSIDDVRQRASETDSMANGVLGASSDLNREADSLKSRIAQFLQAVRAA